MMDHKMAAFAIAAGIGGAGVALSPDNAFTEDAKEIGAGVALLAGVWALGNAKELTEVCSNLVKADNVLRDLKKASERTDQQISDKETELEAARLNLSRVEANLLSLRSAYQRL